eukprot:3263942-Alexandrium_andersonii.AAC.1
MCSHIPEKLLWKCREASQLLREKFQVDARAIAARHGCPMRRLQKKTSINRPDPCSAEFTELHGRYT